MPARISVVLIVNVIGACTDWTKSPRFCPSLRHELTKEVARLDMQIEMLKQSRDPLWRALVRPGDN